MIILSANILFVVQITDFKDKTLWQRHARMVASG